MLLLKCLLTWGGFGMIAMATAILICDFHHEMQHKRVAAGQGAIPPEPGMQWRASVALTLLAWGPLLLATGIVAMTAP